MDASRTAGVFVAAVILCQPAPMTAPDHGPLPGRTGWLSDRGGEVHLRFEGLLAEDREDDTTGEGQGAVRPDPEALRAAVVARVREAARAAGADLPPVPVEASDLEVSFPEPGRSWRADVSFVALDEAASDRVARAGAYRDLDVRVVADRPAAPLHPLVRIVSAPGPDPDRAPDCRVFSPPGGLRVVALFGQMETGRPLAVDQGAVSLRRLHALLRSRGFASAGGTGALEVTVLERAAMPGSGAVRVELVPPDSLLQADKDATAAVLARAVRDADVVYYLGHSGQEPLGVWSDPGTWRGARARLLVLDSCWSFQRSVRGILAAAGSGLDVVSNPFRTWVGSVDSLAVLLDALGECGDPRAAAAPVPPWRTILARMNGLAAERLAARLAENPSTSRREREVYGVSGARSAGPSSRR